MIFKNSDTGLSITTGMRSNEVLDFLEVERAMAREKIDFDKMYDPHMVRKAEAATTAVAVYLEQEISTPDTNVILVDFGQPR